MKLVRLVAVALFLVALSSPAFARCGYCDPWDRCVAGPAPMGCTQKPEGCLENEIFCPGGRAAELTLVSVEIEREVPVVASSTAASMVTPAAAPDAPAPAPEACAVIAEE